MRFSCLVIASAVLFVATSAFAQQQPPVSGSTTNKPRQTTLGSHTCSDIVPCEGSAEASAVTSTQWAAYGDSCMADGFGYANPDGFIDDTAGLDSSGCMTSKVPNGASHGMGTLTPKCCVVTLPTGVCSIHCDLVK